MMTSQAPVYSGPPRVRLSAIGEAWQIEKQQLGVWITAALIVLLLACVAMSPGIVIQTMSQMRNGPPANPWQPPPPPILFQLAMMLVSSAVGAWLGAGLYRMALRQIRGESIGVGDIFSAGYAFGPLFLYVLVLSLPTLVFAYLGLLGQALSIIYSVTVYPALMFVTPLIVDRRLGVMEAVRVNLDALRGQIGSAISLYIALILIIIVSCLPCGLGVFVTIPLLTLTVTVLYRDFFITPGEGLAPDPGTAPPPGPPDTPTTLLDAP